MLGSGDDRGLETVVLPAQRVDDRRHLDCFRAGAHDHGDPLARRAFERLQGGHLDCLAEW